MRTRDLAALVVALAGLACCVAPVAAQQHHHPLHEDFYRTWEAPAGGSCCDARVEKDGVEVGDCEPTEAEVRRGADGAAHWFARLPNRGAFIEIPDVAIIRQRNPEQGGQQGHLCFYFGVVRCFVPPDAGI